MLKTKNDFEMNYMLHKVQKRDSLWSISKKFYGTGIYWESLYADNIKNIGINPNIINEGLDIFVRRKPLSELSVVQSQIEYLHEFDDVYYRHYLWKLQDRYWKLVREKAFICVLVMICGGLLLNKLF